MHVTAPRLRRPATLRLVVVAALVLAFGPPAPTADAGVGGSPSSRATASERGGHEVWALDQGTDLIHIYDSRDDLREIATIDVAPDELGLDVARTVPHMIEFDSQHRFAFVAATAGGVTIVIDARRKEVVDVLPTGPGSHHASVTPDDGEAWVSVLGPSGEVDAAGQAARALVQIRFDLTEEEPTFEVGESVEVKQALERYLDANPTTTAGWAPFRDHRPVCHQYTPDGREAWVTLGPEWDRGGLFVFDLETHEVTHAWDPGTVRANCGVAVNADGSRVVANWSGEVRPGGDSEGEWYVFDARSKQLLATRSARGLDAHGVRFTPDGRHLWAVNRNSDNALLIDARRFEVVREFASFADTPDILDFSPDGSLLYVSQRGPTPISGAAHAAQGNQPGIAVAHTGSGRTLRVLEPPTVRTDDGRVINDLHGVGVRPLTGDAPSAGRAEHRLVRRPAVVGGPVARTHADLTCHLPG